MKFIVAILLTAALGFAAPLYLPWWGFALTSAVVALAVHQKAWKAFIAGFAGLFLLWAGLALFIDAGNNHILLQRVAGIFGVSGIVLIVITGFIGGIVSGFAALAGCYARRLH
ncbi:MAG TPA: hypothetical protein VHB48_13550 [Chitinophagaceae bacterium]|nr:hypothetical protein [Chitinophagaceae bacterium]